MASNRFQRQKRNILYVYVYYIYNNALICIYIYQNKIRKFVGLKSIKFMALTIRHVYGLLFCPTKTQHKHSIHFSLSHVNPKPIPNFCLLQRVKQNILRNLG